MHIYNYVRYAQGIYIRIYLNRKSIYEVLAVIPLARAPGGGDGGGLSGGGMLLDIGRGTGGYCGQSII